MTGTDKPYDVGKGKPPKHTRFGAGNRANPQGKTSAQRQLEIENAERATRIRGRFLEALEGLMNEHPEKEKLIEERLTSEVLRLIKESEDRGLGTPQSKVDLTSSDGTMTPQDHSGAVIAALKAKHAPEPK